MWLRDKIQWSYWRICLFDLPERGFFFFAEDNAHHIAPQGFVLNTNVDHHIFLLARLSMESQRKRHSISTCHKIEIILTPSLINAYYEPQLKSSTH